MMVKDVMQVGEETPQKHKILNNHTHKTEVELKDCHTEDLRFDEKALERNNDWPCQKRLMAN